MFPARERVPTSVYLVGPLTGISDAFAPAFHRAGEHLRTMGYLVCSPVEGRRAGAPYAQLTRFSLANLSLVEGVLVLPGWEHARNSLVEVLVAHELGLPVAQYDLARGWGEAVPLALIISARQLTLLELKGTAHDLYSR